MRRRFQKPDLSILKKALYDLSIVLGSFIMFAFGFIFEVKKGNASSACMFAGAILMIVKLLEFQIKTLRK